MRCRPTTRGWRTFCQARALTHSLTTRPRKRCHAPAAGHQRAARRGAATLLLASSARRTPPPAARRHEGWLSWHSVATLAYHLIDRLGSRPCWPETSFAACWTGPTWREPAVPRRSPRWTRPLRDFEDALQVALRWPAVRNSSRATSDFKSSPVPALVRRFLRRHHERAGPSQIPDAAAGPAVCPDGHTGRARDGPGLSC